MWYIFVLAICTYQETIKVHKKSCCVFCNVISEFKRERQSRIHPTRCTWLTSCSNFFVMQTFDFEACKCHGQNLSRTLKLEQKSNTNQIGKKQIYLLTHISKKCNEGSPRLKEARNLCCGGFATFFCQIYPPSRLWNWLNDLI